MPPRSLRRRGGSQRWLIIPFTLTIVVVLIDASMHARSPKLATTVNTQAWVDKVLPDIAASSTQGRELAQLTSGKTSGSTQALGSQLASIEAAAARTYAAVASSGPTPQAAVAAGLLEASLSARQEAVAAMAGAARQVLAGHSGPALSSMNRAVSDIQVGDSAYMLFTRQSSKLGAPLPASQWLSAGTYEPRALRAFAQRLVTGVERGPAQAMTIDAVSTNPPPLSLQGKVEILSPASSISVTVDIADRGRSALKGVVVTASLVPSANGASQQLSQNVDIQPGRAVAVTLSGLTPALSTPATLTVTATGAGGTPTKVTRSVRVEVPGANFRGTSSTTTARGATTTTTAPGAQTSGSTAAVTTTSPPAPTTTTVPATTSSPPAATTTSPAAATTTARPATTTRTTTTTVPGRPSTT